MTKTLPVALGARSYTIHIGADLGSELARTVGELRAAGRRVAVIADEVVLKKQRKILAWAGRDATVLALPGAETSKSLKMLGKVYDWMAQNAMDRRTAVFAVGGGVMGDLAGFAAASYLRGLDFYQVPTSLLAMVDSSVGGKTGINLKAGKNLVGAFWQPKAVFEDTRFLRTLGAREFDFGMAEVIKYGMLGDARLFAQLERGAPWHGGHPELPGVIRDCCALKAKIVADDEFEMKPSGGRALLNLGHTFGHAIEKVAGYKPQYGHGYAVGIGLALAARLSHRLGWLGEKEVARVERMVGVCKNLNIKLPKGFPVRALMDAMKRDKKVRAGKMRFVAMRAIGRAETVDDVPEDWVRELWREAGAK